MFRINGLSMWAGALFGGMLLLIVGAGSDLLASGMALWLKGPTLHGNGADVVESTDPQYRLAAGRIALHEEDGESVRVVSYNIRHARGEDGKVDLDRIAAVLGQVDADVIALQEVDRYRSRSGMQDQIAWLGEKLGMSWHYAPTLQNGWSQYGNAILTRLPIVDYGVEMLEGIKEPRNLMRIQVQSPNETVTIYNTHLGVFQEERQSQMTRIIELVEPQTGPAIIMGDFNMSDTHLLMQPLLVEWQVIPFAGGTLPDGSKADHVLLRPLAPVMKAQIHRSQASDHAAVVATIDWGNMPSISQ